MEKFTVSEVREHAIWVGGVAGMGNSKTYTMLHAYADRLEAQERAVPVAITCDGYDGDRTGCIKSDKPLPLGTNLYTHPAPADAKRLAEALRELANRWEQRDYDASRARNAAGHDHAMELRQMITAHCAQAQPPAASVLDGVNQGLLIGTSPDGRPYAMRGTPESVAVVSAMLEHAGTSQQLTMESGND